MLPCSNTNYLNKHPPGVFQQHQMQNVPDYLWDDQHVHTTVLRSHITSTFQSYSIYCQKCRSIITYLLTDVFIPKLSQSLTANLQHYNGTSRAWTAVIILPFLISSYTLLFSDFLSTARSWENLHLSPLVHWPCLKNAHSTDFGSVPVNRHKV